MRLNHRSFAYHFGLASTHDKGVCAWTKIIKSWELMRTSQHLFPIALVCVAYGWLKKVYSIRGSMHNN